MNPHTLIKVLSLLAVFLNQNALATYYYNSEDIQQKVVNEATRQNVDPSLALAIAKVESNFNPYALSHAGAKGVMQIMPRTAEQVFGVSRNRLFEPNVNIELGITFIKRLLARYDGRLDIALSHYNGGSGVKNNHGELHVMPSTRRYVDKVLSAQQLFSQVSPIPHSFLQQNPSPPKKEPRFYPQQNQTGIIFTNTNAVETQAESSQIETLRALRLHNITRNYKGKIVQPYTNNTALIETLPSNQVTLSKQRQKVRQWESIYPN